MATTPFQINQFGGLDLLRDPTEIGAGAATSLSNVELDQRGRLRSRDGSSLVNGIVATNAPSLGMAYYKDGGAGEWLIVADPGSPGLYRPLNLGTNAAGSTLAETLVAGVTSNNSFARFGDTSVTRIYAGGSTLRYFGGSVWSSPGTPPPIAPNLLAVTANDNRLAIATGSSSRIHWSDAGAPETYGANNYVELWPGDGESVKALIRWQDYLFAFKQTKFAVFTGTSVDSSGNPVFNYRGVDSGRGVYSVGQAVAGEQGVYFADRSGIYVTTGGAPQYISQAIEPWLYAGTFGSLPTFTLSSAQLTFYRRRLYVTFPNGTSSVTLVYETQTGQWFAWQGGQLVAAAVPGSSQYEGLYFGDSATKKITKLDTAVTTDNGVAISWNYTSGMYDAGYPGQVKIALESQMVGTGTASLQMATSGGGGSSAGVFDTAGSVTMGTAPVYAEGWRQTDFEGAYFQHKLSGTGAATIASLTHYLSFVKSPGVW